MESTGLKIAGVDVSAPSKEGHRLLMLLWGNAGCGKTTLASTAPGKKLWITFDNDALSPVNNRDDIIEADFSAVDSGFVLRASNSPTNPMSLGQTLDKLPDVETIVIDSITSFNEIALEQAIKDTPKADYHNPTLQGYGRRKQYTARFLYGMINLTAKRGLNLIIIGHEDAPEKDEITGEISVNILLGGTLKKEVPIKLSEVWYMEDTGKQHKVYVRPFGSRKNIKTRMFNPGDANSFIWKYDPDTMKGTTLEQLYTKWKEGKYKKLSLPK